MTGWDAMYCVVFCTVYYNLFVTIHESEEKQVLENQICTDFNILIIKRIGEILREM